MALLCHATPFRPPHASHVSSSSPHSITHRLTHLGAQKTGPGLRKLPTAFLVETEAPILVSCEIFLKKCTIGKGRAGFAHYALLISAAQANPGEVAANKGRSAAAAGNGEWRLEKRSSASLLNTFQRLHCLCRLRCADSEVLKLHS